MRQLATLPVLDYFFPPECLACSQFVSSYGLLCSECWQGLTHLTDPLCRACGLPFEYDSGESLTCGDCLKELPPFAQARAALKYDEISKKLVLGLKYHDQAHLASWLGPWLMQAGGEMVRRADLIVPVPLHYRRYVARRYNQSALLAQVVSRLGGVEMLPDALVRTRATRKQTGLTRSQREQNVRGAFSANPRHPEVLKGKNVLLVDDVYTTGATLHACTKALLKGGAQQVNALTLARAL